MKKITLLLVTLLIGVTTQAQITINASDFAFNTPGGDTSYYYGFERSEVSLPQFGADMFWDYSTIPLDTNTYHFSYEAATHPDFPTANLRRTTTVGYIGVELPSYFYYTFDATGFYYNGKLDVSVALPLGNATGNPADTLSVIGGGRLESTPIPSVTFPLNYGDISTIISYSSINFIANVPSFGLSNVAVEQRHKKVVETEVKGWGKIALLNPETQAVDTFEVLLLHQTEAQVDSFYDAANDPLPASLLTPLGYTQGQSYPVEHIYRMFSPGLDFYAMHFIATDGDITDAAFNKSIFTLGTAVNTSSIEVTAVTHEIYPNPIPNNQFQLKIEKNNSENWQLNLYNSIGQLVHNELIINNISTIELNNNLSSGQYFYTISNEKGQVRANGKLIK